MFEDKIRKLIPNAAVEFLSGIIRDASAIKVIRLVPVKLGFGCIQEVVYVSKNEIITRRVFGFKPISADLDVSRDDTGIAVRLAA
jgi:hypothetical protein